MRIPRTEIRATKDGIELLKATLEPGEYVIGSGTDSEIRLPEYEVESRHALLTVNFRELLIEDLGSSAGTFINERKVSGARRLFPNQRIRVGSVTIEARRLQERDDPALSLDFHQQTVQRYLPPDYLKQRRYGIGGVVAQGGMGAILDAVDEPLKRTVAMKVMLQEGSQEELVRFIEEAQITGQLEHPNIVPVHELGVDEQEQVYYTMKFVRGTTLRKVFDALAAGTEEALRRYPLAQLLTVFQKVCDAVAFAHSKGVIHRDLKPENVMLGDFGEVLVMDWGLAKARAQKSDAAAIKEAAARSGIRSVRAEPDNFTHTIAGSIVGTPHYMSPEQANGIVDALDERADIYALGAILYHLLALESPVAGEDLEAVLENVRMGRVALGLTDRKRKLPHLPGARMPESLVPVVRKAMALDPQARYATVPQFQAEITAYQAGFATAAEHAGPWKQFTLLVRRNRGVSTAVAAALALFAASSAAFTMRVIKERNRAETQRTRAEREERVAKTEREHAENALAQSEESLLQIKYRKALEALDRDEPAEALAWLAAVLRQQPAHPTAGSLIISILNERSFALPVGSPIKDFYGYEVALQFLPDGRLLTRNESAVTLRDFGTGQLLAKFPGSGRATFTSDGQWLLLGSAPTWISIDKPDAAVDVWHIATQKKVAHLQHEDVISALALNSSNTRLATGDRKGRVKIWRVPEWTLERGDLSSSGAARSMNWSADGSLLAVSSNGSEAPSIFNLNDRAESVPQWPGVVAAFSPNSDVVVSNVRGSMQIMDFKGWIIAPLRRPFGAKLVAFAPAGVRMGVLSLDRNEARLLSVRTGEESSPPLALPGSGVTLSWTPEGSRLLSVTSNGKLQLWDGILGTRLGQELAKRVGGGWSPSLSPDGEHVAIPSKGEVERWTLKDGSALTEKIRPLYPLGQYFPNPKCTAALAMSNGNADECVVDLSSGVQRKCSTPSGPAAFSPDGTKFAIASGSSRTLTVWDATTLKTLSPAIPILHNAAGVNFSHSGVLVAYMDESDELEGGAVFDWKTGTRICRLDAKLAGGIPRWSPDDGKIFVHTFGGPALFDALDGHLIWHHWGDASALRSDFTQMAVAERSGSVSLCDVMTGKLNGTKLPHDQFVTALAYSPDGSLLATGSQDQSARLWDVRTGKLVGPAMRHDGAVHRVVFSTDGKRLATATAEGRIRLWNVATAQPLTVALPPRGALISLFFDAERNRLISASRVSIYSDEIPPLPNLAPPWLPDFCEAVAQRAMDETGELTKAGVFDIAPMRERLVSGSGDDAYSIWVRWFFADRSDRTISAFSDVVMSKGIESLVSLGFHSDLEEAHRRRPTDSDIMKRLAGRYGHNDGTAAAANAEFLEALADWNKNSGAEARILEAQRKMQEIAWDERGYLRRDPKATARQIDLTAYYNGSLSENFRAPRNDAFNLDALPRGLQTLEGVLFDLRGIVALKGAGSGLQSLPERVSAIRISQNAHRLHFLHASNSNAASGAKIGEFVLHYRDGQMATLPIVYGEDTRDWAAKVEPGGQTTRAKVAWSGLGESSEGMRLFLRTYDNPRPEAEIATLDFVSANASCAPFVVAITVEP